MKRQASAPTIGATIEGNAAVALITLLPRAVKRKRDCETQDRFEHEAGRYDFEGLQERRAELRCARDTDIVAEPLEVALR